MPRIVIVHPLQVFINGLVPMLIESGAVMLAGHFTSTEGLLALVQSLEADMLLIAERMANPFAAIAAMVDRKPEVKVILFVPDHTDEHLHKMIEYGAHSVLPESTNAEELLDCVLAVHEDREHLPDEVQHRINKLYREDHSRTLRIKLTPREQEILDCIGNGMKKQQIATHLGIEMNTLNSHLKNLYGKFDVHNLHEVEHKARRLQYIK